VSDDWAAVAVAVNARVAELRMTQQDLASASKVSPATIREIQHNHRPRRRYGRTLAALSEALQWPSGHLDAVLSGQVAEEIEPPLDEDGAVLTELRAIHAELQGIKARLNVLETGVSPDAD
jgi:transcriptional regulator with XRE-family HTH domain